MSSESVVQQLLAYGNIHSRAYHNLETLCICFPGRVTGSEILESALDFIIEVGTSEMGLKVCVENVQGVPNWIRGDSDKEKLLVDIEDNGIWPEPNPKKRVFRIMANGMSIGTGEDGVAGPIISCKSIDELKSLGTAKVQGSIVLLDYGHYTIYKELSGAVRGKGAIEASRLGALAYLHRVIAPDDSLSGLHTGTIYPFPNDVQPIPSAGVTIEDAELLTRLLRRGYGLYGSVTLPCRRYEDKTSRNVIFEIKGSGPNGDEVVLIGAHTDSWDCGNSACQGAHDDGQGILCCLEALRTIQQCGLSPSRTIRCVLFVDEEVRQTGSIAYAAGCTDLDKIVVALETDLGAGPVCGFGLQAGCGADEIVSKILQPMNPINKFKNSLRNAKGEPLCKDCHTVNYVSSEWQGWGMDMYPLVVNEGIPGMLLRHEDSWWDHDYFHFHHTAVDTINNINAELLLLNQHVMTAATWLLANATAADQVIPRGEKQANKFY